MLKASQICPFFSIAIGTSTPPIEWEKELWADDDFFFSVEI